MRMQFLGQFLSANAIVAAGLILILLAIRGFYAMQWINPPRW